MIEYLDWNPGELKARYAEIAEQLAQLHREIAFLKVQEIEKVPPARAERVEREGERDALIEEKFLLRMLVDG